MLSRFAPCLPLGDPCLCCSLPAVSSWSFVAFASSSSSSLASLGSSVSVCPCCLSVTACPVASSSMLPFTVVGCILEVFDNVDFVDVVSSTL